MVTTMKYLVTDDFVAAHGWTPDKTANILGSRWRASAYLSKEFVVSEMGAFSPLGCSPMPSGQKRLK
jgi:hypothetical protein